MIIWMTPKRYVDVAEETANEYAGLLYVVEEDGTHRLIESGHWPKRLFPVKEGERPNA